jgi:hypothetical protein
VNDESTETSSHQSSLHERLAELCINFESTETSSHQSSLHERLAELCINFHQLQDELLNEADAEKGSRLQQIASTLIGLGREQNDQLLGELFLSEHSNYNFTKPLYIGVSLVSIGAFKLQLYQTALYWRVAG